MPPLPPLPSAPLPDGGGSATPTVPAPSTQPSTQPTPEAPPPAPASIPTAHRATVVRTSLNGRVVRLRLTCSANGTVQLQSRSGAALASGAFRCRTGVADARLRLGRTALRRLKGDHPKVNVVIVSNGRTDRTKLSLKRGTRARSTAASAALTTVNAQCLGSGTGLGGVETISVLFDETFGMANYGETVWYTSWLYTYLPGNPSASKWIGGQGWQHYMAAQYGASGSGGGGVVIVGGTSPGGGTSQVWNVGSQTWTYAIVLVYTQRAGYKWVWVPSSPENVIAPARYWSGWCGFA
jgi:hypothetical protein